MLYFVIPYRNICVCMRTSASLELIIYFLKFVIRSVATICFQFV